MTPWSRNDFRYAKQNWELNFMTRVLVPKGKKTRISSCFSTIFHQLLTVCSTKSPHCNLKLLPQNSHYVPENFKLLTLGNYFHFHAENPSYLSQNKEILFPPPSKFQTLTTFSHTLVYNVRNSKHCMGMNIEYRYWTSDKNAIYIFYDFLKQHI